jgi:hypothetical protein
MIAMKNNGNNKMKERNECFCASLSHVANCSEQASHKKDSFEFSRPISSRKGLAAIHVLVLTLFLVGIIIVFVAMVQNSNLKEFKVLRENVNIMYTEGFGTLLNTSLETSWRVIATQTLFSALDERFGLQEYFYNYSVDISPDLSAPLPEGCRSDKRLCLLTTNYTTSKLTELIGSIHLPSSFNVFVRAGRGLLEYTRNVALASTEQTLAIAADRMQGRINQTVSTTEPTATGTSINANYTILPEIDTQLWQLVNAVSPAVSIATQLRAPSNAISYADTRGLTIGTLQRFFESGFEAVRDVAGAGNTRYRLLPAFKSNGSELRLGYDATVVLADDNRSIASGLVGGIACSGMRTDMYNKYAGAIERAKPDRLLQYVEKPRALLAAIAQTMSGWDPVAATVDAGGSHNGLFGVLNGSFEPHTNAAQAVAELKRWFENYPALTSDELLRTMLANYTNSSITDARITSIMLAYDNPSPGTSSWRPCIMLSQSGSTNNPNRIFGPEDYARFLTTDTQTVRVGDDFCSASDYPIRGYNKLAYDFYSDATSWLVRAAYPGKVVLVDGSTAMEEGCSGTVWIQTGDFVVAYMHISPVVNVNDVVYAGQRIGTVRTFPRQICPQSKLTVLISSLAWTVPANAAEDTNACGTRTQCSAAAEYYGAGGSVYTPNVDPKYQHCGALEWDALFSERTEGEGRYWRLLESRNEWVRMPLAMDFKMADSFTVLNCSSDGLHRWQNENDLLCYNGTLRSCSNEIAGAEVATAGTTLGGYTCAAMRFVTTTELQVTPEFKIFSSDDTHTAYDNFVKGKQLTKWCTNDELNSDWLCCTASGKQLKCLLNKYEVVGDTLRCTEEVTCE